MSSGKLYGLGGEHRTAKVRAIGALCGVDFEYKEITPGNLKKGISPSGRLPVYYEGETLIGFSSGSILRYFIEKSGKFDLVCGKGTFEASLVDSWCEYSQQELEVLCEASVLKKGDKVPGTSGDLIKCASSAKDTLVNKLSTTLEKHLATKTFLVGDKLTIADITIACALLLPFSKAIEPQTRKGRLPNIVRWFDTCLEQAKLGDYFKFSYFSASKSSGSSKSSGKVSGGNVDLDKFTSSGSSKATTSSKFKTLFKRERLRVRDILKSSLPVEELVGSKVVVCGWARTIREGQKGALLFVELNDGSCFESLQIVASEGDTEGFEALGSCGGAGSSHRFVGELVESPAKGQKVEVKALSVEVLGTVDANAYPLKKTGKSQKGHSVEFLRDHAHLRARSHLIGAVARVRNACAHAVHSFFNERGFLYVHTPLITGSDCEGAGEMFAVTTLLGQAKDGKLPTVTKEKLKTLPDAKIGDIDYSADFFGRPTYLTVSGQLNVETYACALSDVYTFGPTFRAENSYTSRHLAEFWMIEPELCFASLEDDMNLAEDFLKYCVQYVMDHCPSDIDFFEQRVEKGLKDRLLNVLESPFVRLTYTKAIEILNQDHPEKPKWEEEPTWGIDLGSEHERFLTEKVYKKPVILTDYPADIKAFYMRQNELDSEGRLTVQAMDILVPRIGEIIGGSAREERMELLEQRITDMKLEIEDFDWYCDLRKYGSVPHAGFGLGFERLILFTTGVANIRDVIPFPRWPKHCTF